MAQGPVGVETTIERLLRLTRSTDTIQTSMPVANDNAYAASEARNYFGEDTDFESIYCGNGHIIICVAEQIAVVDGIEKVLSNRQHSFLLYLGHPKRFNRPQGFRPLLENIWRIKFEPNEGVTNQQRKMVQSFATNIRFRLIKGVELIDPKMSADELIDPKTGFLRHTPSGFQLAPDYKSYDRKRRLNV